MVRSSGDVPGGGYIPATWTDDDNEKSRRGDSGLREQRGGAGADALEDLGVVGDGVEDGADGVELDGVAGFGLFGEEFDLRVEGEAVVTVLGFELAAFVEGEGDGLEGVGEGDDGFVFGVVVDAGGGAGGGGVGEGFGAGVGDVFGFGGAAGFEAVGAVEAVEKLGSGDGAEGGGDSDVGVGLGLEGGRVGAVFRDLRRVGDLVGCGAVSVDGEGEVGDDVAGALEAEGDGVSGVWGTACAERAINGGLPGRRGFGRSGGGRYRGQGRRRRRGSRVAGRA